MHRRGVDGRSVDDDDDGTMKGHTRLRSRRAVQPDFASTSPQQDKMAGTCLDRPPRQSKRRKIVHIRTPTVICALLASHLPTAIAQSCISLTGSAECPSFNASSISTDIALVGLFPFLSSVTDLSSFDTGLANYIANGFVSTRYVPGEYGQIATALTDVASDIQI